MTTLSVFSSIGNFFSTIWPYVVAVLVFLFMIFIHEFGHFIAAKLMGVRVNEFAIGFGPTLLKKQGKETLYALRAVPFGGFCAMEGESEESHDDKAFCNKKAWRRFVIVIAGAFMNLVFGFILVMIILAPHDRYASTKIAVFEENAVSQQSGLMVGDEIIKVDGRRVLTSTDLGYCFSTLDSDVLKMTVKRDGNVKDLDVKFDTAVENGFRYVKMDFKVAPIEKTFGSYLSQSVKTTVSYAKTVWFSLVDLLTGKFGISAVSGPVGVTAVIGDAAKSGILDLLPIIALITINLGVFNLLPIPALDGGRAFFLLIEMIIRRPIPQKFESMVHAVGLVILLGFIALVTIKDIFGLF